MAKKEAKKDWRKAVQQAMEKSSKDEALRRFGTAEPGFNYRWEHVQAVVKLAVRLARLTGADKDVVEAAAWLHDVAKEKGAKHPEEGAKVARKLLPKTDFPAEKIEAVAQAVTQHMGLWREQPLTNLEAMVLWDADKLAKIGLTAARHPGRASVVVNGEAEEKETQMGRSVLPKRSVKPRANMVWKLFWWETNLSSSRCLKNKIPRD